MSKIERGERRLGFIELRRWLRALGVPIIDFVTGFESYIRKNKKAAQWKDSRIYPLRGLILILIKPRLPPGAYLSLRQMPSLKR